MSVIAWIDGHKISYNCLLFVLFFLFVGLRYSGQWTDKTSYEESLARLNAFAVFGLVGINAILALGIFYTHKFDHSEHAKLPSNAYMVPRIVMKILIIWLNFFLLAVASGLDRDGYIWLIVDVVLNLVLLWSALLAYNWSYILKPTTYFVDDRPVIKHEPVKRGEYTFYMIANHVISPVLTAIFPVVMYLCFLYHYVTFDQFSYSVATLATMLVCELSVKNTGKIIKAWYTDDELPFIDKAMLLSLLCIGTIQMTLGISLMALAMTISNGVTTISPSVSLLIERRRAFQPTNKYELPSTTGEVVLK